MNLICRIFIAGKSTLTVHSALLLSMLFVCHLSARAEWKDDHFSDSLKRDLGKAGTEAEKVGVLSDLADHYFNRNVDSFRRYAAEALRVAELSRDRRLVITVHLNNGERCLKWGNGLSRYAQMGKESDQKAANLAKENGLDDLLAFSYLGLSRFALDDGKPDIAFNYTGLAMAIAGSSQNDSLKMWTQLVISMSYQARNDRLLAFRSLLNALDIAENSGRKSLLKQAYFYLSYFYRNLGEYDKAIDFLTKIVEIDRLEGNRFRLVDDYFQMAKLFTAKGEPGVALSLYEHCSALADSIQFEEFKINITTNTLILFYTNYGEARGREYMAKHGEMVEFIQRAGLFHILDEQTGKAFSNGGRYDSALYYYRKIAPEFEKTDPYQRFEFYTLFGTLYKRMGNQDAALPWFLKARETGLQSGDLNQLLTAAGELDSIYRRKGDYKTAFGYNEEYNRYRDSLQALSRATDLLKLEVENDNKQRERLAREAEANTLRRHNIQYMGFTVGLICLFVLLGVAGLFVVSPRTIRALGFISFIFFFEFIILLTDKRIQEWTHDEPWMVLGIKILLAAILLPLHHWLEHKVIHYLTNRRKLSLSGGVAGASAETGGPGAGAGMASVPVPEGDRGKG